MSVINSFFIWSILMKKTIKKKTVKKKTKSSFDKLGTLGVLGSVLQSTVVKLGNVSEKLVREHFLRNGFDDLNTMCSVVFDKSVKKPKKYHFGNDFLKSFDPNKKYIGQKILFSYEGRNIQTDLVIYKDKTFYVIEVKSSSQFDTKKAPAEQVSLFENTLVLNKLVYKSFGNTFDDYKIKGAICCLDAENKAEIYTGFKQYVSDNTKIWEDSDFHDIVRGFLAIIKRQDLFGEPNIDVILKAFVMSNIERHDFFIQPIVKKYVNFVFTGEELFTLFDLDYQSLCIERTNYARAILMQTLDEKIDINIQPELYTCVSNTIEAFADLDKLFDTA